jgi:hypothetical protein
MFSIKINIATTALHLQVRTLGEPAQPERYFRKNCSKTYLTRTLTDPLINGGWLCIVNGGGKCRIEGGGDGKGGMAVALALRVAWWDSMMRQYYETRHQGTTLSNYLHSWGSLKWIFYCLWPLTGSRRYKNNTVPGKRSQSETPLSKSPVPINTMLYLRVTCWATEKLPKISECFARTDTCNRQKQITKWDIQKI